MALHTLRDRVLALREASNTRRCHTLPHFGEYTDGKHSFDAAMLLDLLYPAASKRLLLAVLKHDLAERWVGDSPSPALAHWPDLGQAYVNAEAQVLHTLFNGEDIYEGLTSEEMHWIKAIDRVELYLWCHDQRAMGNRNVEPWLASIWETVMSDPNTPKGVRDFVVVYARGGWRRIDNKEVME